MQSLAASPMVGRVQELLRSRPQRIAATDAHEGPVYAPAEDALYFTSAPMAAPTPRVDIRRIEMSSGAVSTVVEDADAANGMTLGHDGQLVVCHQGSRSRPARIGTIDPATGAGATIVEEVGGRPLNSPNDVVVRSDGTIWFTDPSYGHLQGFRPAPELPDAVYRHDPATGETTVATTGPEKPNGLAFSPDESVLYVTDSGANQEPGSFYEELPHHVVAHDVHAGGSLGAPRVLFVTRPGFPDGIKVDEDGRIYASSAGGVQVFDRCGAALGEIRLAGAVNFTFGGPGRNVLFITADTAIWAAVLNVRGA
jgi:gluconolactonase